VGAGHPMDGALVGAGHPMDGALVGAGGCLNFKRLLRPNLKTGSHFPVHTYIHTPPPPRQEIV
jgi:hypothetical protein